MRPSEFLWALAFAFLLCNHGVAQLSPGKLAAPHQELEGIRNCTLCHALGDAVRDDLCLSCHVLLASRIDTDKGYHASSIVREKSCASCHSDHHGLEFEMIHWPEGHRQFDHELAGWRLQGAHSTIECRDCHRTELVDSGMLQIEPGISLGTTYLGLDAACSSCHLDVHRGELGQSCLDCHNEDKWIPASGFSHDSTRYSLQGAHQSLSCKACHSSWQWASNSTWKVDVARQWGELLQYSGLEYGACTDCHTDPHKGKLGAACTECHDENSFHTTLQRFNHQRTLYPLEGMHRDLACSACHGTPPERIARPPFPECHYCHKDPHHNQLDAPDGSKRCKECHTLDRFLPSSYDIEDHEASGFPLSGGHLATPCSQCHTPLAEPGTGNRYTFQDTRCQLCHKDPHKGEADRWMKQEDCAACHQLDSWRGCRFDHELSVFRLKGAHQSTACSACHTVSGDTRLLGLPQDCMGCHQDPHRSQFTDAGSLGCGECHHEENWSATHFDHTKMSAFLLDGAHEGLNCASCHPRETDEEGEFIRYRPLAHACVDCHGESKP